MLKFEVIGNLGADAKMKSSNGRQYVTFDVAHSEQWTDAAGVQHSTSIWVSCAMSGDGGNLLKHLVKGKKVRVYGDGSARVYSSAVQRKMVAGLNLNVRDIELLGGSTDDVPRQLVDENGAIHVVNKAYYVPQQEALEIGAKEGRVAFLKSVSGSMFSVDYNGFVQPMVTPGNDSENDTTENVQQ